MDMTTTQDPADTDSKRQRLEALLRQRAAAPRDTPLSVGQERLYRLSQLSPGEPFYNVAVAYRLRGPLDAKALERAVLRIAERHEVLRACFPTMGGRPVQRVTPRPADGLLQHRVIAPDTIDAAVAAEAAQPFDLAKGPLWRVGLFGVGVDDHVLTLVMHHIVTDGWSFALILRELGALTAALAADGPTPPEASAVQYSAYADRQRAGFADPGHAAQEAYWTQHLEGRIPALDLPVDRHDPTGADRTADSLPLGLPEDLGEALTGFGRREGVTAFMLTLAGFAAMLHRWSGQTDLLLCTPVTGRHRAQSREVVGYCNNILPIRLDLGGNPTLGDVVQRVRTATLAAHRNQDVPFETVAQAPSLRRVPLSRLLFSLDMPWPPALEIAGLDIHPLRVETGSADFDLSVSLWPVGDTLDGTLRYKTALFGPARVEAIAAAYRKTLATLVEAPDTPIAALAPALPQASEAAGPVQAAAAVERPRFPLEEKLAQLWRSVFEVRDIGIHDDFRAIGASSFSVALLAERIATTLDTAIDLPTLFRAGTIARLAALLERQDAALADDPLAPIRTEGTKPPLFLVEGVSVYYALAGRLAGDRPIYGLVRPVVSDFATVEDMAASYVEAILRVCPTGPCHLGGLSFGGLVAFEVAHQLAARGVAVGALALFDTPGPDAYRPKGAMGRALGHVGNVLRFGMPYLRQKLGRRVERHFPRRAPTAPAGAGAGLDAAAQRSAFRRYASRYEIRPYDRLIVLFKLAHRDAMSDSLFDPALGHIDPLLGWGAVARGRLECHAIQGDHIGLLREPNVGVLAAALDSHLG